jgi:hypothetical protein
MPPYEEQHITGPSFSQGYESQPTSTSTWDFFKLPMSPPLSTPAPHELCTYLLPNNHYAQPYADDQQLTAHHGFTNSLIHDLHEPSSSPICHSVAAVKSHETTRKRRTHPFFYTPYVRDKGRTCLKYSEAQKSHATPDSYVGYSDLYHLISLLSFTDSFFSIKSTLGPGAK